jgi:hypothetical protein
MQLGPPTIGLHSDFVIGQTPNALKKQGRTRLPQRRLLARRIAETQRVGERVLLIGRRTVSSAAEQEFRRKYRARGIPQDNPKRK